jgi:hypothetical protein
MYVDEDIAYLCFVVARLSICSIRFDLVASAPPLKFPWQPLFAVVILFFY